MTIPDAARLTSLIAGTEPLTWVLTGDSITHGLVHTGGGRSYPEHLHELVRGELGRTRDVLITTAISGHRITQLLNEDFDRMVATWAPQIVTLMIGTNDCSDAGISFPVITADAFGADLARFVTRVRDLGAIPVLQTPPPVDTANSPERARVGEFADEVRRVAADAGVVLADHLAAFTRLGEGTMPWRLMNDPFHPNATGHAQLAVELARALGIDPDGHTLARLRGLVGA